MTSGTDPVLEAQLAALSAISNAAVIGPVQVRAPGPPVATRTVATRTVASANIDDLDCLDFVMSFDDDQGEFEHPPIEERQYQADAITACLIELERNRKTILHMACRCGKTYVGYKVMQEWVRRPENRTHGRALVLVPYLDLIHQIARKLVSYGLDPDSIIMVGSGPNATINEKTVPMTTDLAQIREKVRDAQGAGQFLVVISTYQSSEIASAVSYDFTLFDECHRVCGGGRPRPANHVLLSVPEAQTGPRLFMTATPVYQSADIHMKDISRFGGVAYKYHLRQGIDAGYVNDFELQLVASSTDAFAGLSRLGAGEPAPMPAPGPEEAQATGWAWWRRLVTTVVSFFKEVPEVQENRSGVPLETINEYCREKFLAAQVVLAFDHLTTPPADDSLHRRSKLLVFCRTIEGAKTLRDQVAELYRILGAEEVPALLVASSRSSRAERRAVYENMLSHPREPAILFNCKLFQEGVEFPYLNGVFFATPRHSSRDIIQSMSRPLTRVPGKMRSVIYIPVPPDAQPEGGGDGKRKTPPGLSRFETLLPFAEALVSEDTRFYDHLLDPTTPYPLGWLGVYGNAEELLHKARRAFRYRRRGNGVRDLLTQNCNIPWNVAFAELRRIVEVCRRYPKKGTDGFRFTSARTLGSDGVSGETVGLNFGNWMDWVRGQYVKYQSGEASALQPHQVRDLESLEDWHSWGLHGPYWPEKCMDIFESVLERTRGTMPPVNIMNGGWVGLDATELERLSGFFTVMNQQDGKTTRAATAHRGFKVNPVTAARLDEICERYGLVWRKEREYSAADLQEVLDKGGAASPAEAADVLKREGRPGHLKMQGSKYGGSPTMIQRAHAEFMRHAKQNPDGEFIQRHWPGFPAKHKHQELAHVWEQGLAPPSVRKDGRFVNRQGAN